MRRNRLWRLCARCRRAQALWPFLMQSANLRRRLQRLLLPPEGQTKRLNLRDRVARVAWRETQSELESLLLLHRAMHTAFGADEARRKLRLSPPFTVRYAVENRFPRIYVTNHLRRRSLHRPGWMPSAIGRR